MIRLLIASGIRFYVEGLSGLLPERGSVELVGSAFDWASALDELTRLRPDVLLVDASLPPHPDRLRVIRETAPSTKIVVMALPSAAEVVLDWVEAGADGYVPRDGSLTDLAEAIEAAARDEVCCSPKVAAELFRRLSSMAERLDEREAAPDALTSREREVAELIASGLSNKGISRQLGIAMSTTKNHVHSILSKLEMERRSQVVAWHHIRRTFKDRRASNRV